MASLIPTSFVLACFAFTGLNPGLDIEQRTSICEAIEYNATSGGFDPSLVAGMAWVESRFETSAVSGSNARGPLQVIIGRKWSPKYSENDMIDPWLGVEAGVLMAERWRKRDAKRWLECYNVGNSCEASSYRRAVESAARKIRRLKGRVENALENRTKLEWCEP